MISIFFGQLFDRKLTQTIPAAVYLFMLLSYLLAITGHVSHIISMLAVYETGGIAAIFYLSLVKRKDVREPFKDIGNLIFIILIFILWGISLHMRVTNFDDFHSWAITPKDMYFVNGLPTGSMASTYYRDYFPTVYIIDFLIFKLLGRFSESAMFFALWALMLVSLTGFLHRRDGEDRMFYACRAVAGIMLPFLISFQFLHCLGTDILATTVFGSSLVYILEGSDPDDVFSFSRIILAVTILGMLKTTSLMLAMVCLGVYFVRNIEIRKIMFWVRFLMLSGTTVAFWYSWKYFCRIKGNSTYLSDNLENNLASGHSGFPDYAASTVRDFIGRLFTYGLNDGGAGLTSIMILIIFSVSFIIYMRHNDNIRRDLSSFVVILLGMAAYLLVMIYIYLFVFEEWEALSLSSYDRYISTYFGAMLFIALYLMLGKDDWPRWVRPLVVILLAMTINFGYVAKTMIVSGYEKEYGSLIAEIDSIEEEFMQKAGNLPTYGENIVIVDYSDDQLRAKVLPYAAVPGVTRLIRPDDKGAMPDEKEIAYEAAEYNARIIDLRR